jgi:uncharacterized damage-inducible protein DinB
MTFPRYHWFDRTFPFPIPIELFAETLERLRGTPARLEERVHGAADEATRERVDDRWSIRENIGHLTDLEPLWLGRAIDLEQGLDQLRPADLQNRATHAASHNETDLSALLTAFRTERAKLVAKLASFTPDLIVRAAKHPRLHTPMTVVDLAYFVAEHDDHHLARIGALTPTR